MASTAVASIEKIAGWAKVSAAEDGPLDGAVTDQHLRDVCGFAVQWESLAERLGVGEADLEGVKLDGPDARRKRELVLKKWKAAQVFDATYRRLGEAFRGLGRADLCLEVFKLAAKAAASLEGGSASGDGTTTSGAGNVNGRAKEQGSTATTTDESEPKTAGKAQPKPGDQGPSQHEATGKAQPTPSDQGPSQREATDKLFTDKEEKILDVFAKRVLKKYNVDSSPLDQKLDFPYVRSALTDVADKWKPIGSVLGLTTAELNAIKAKNENNVDQCLNDMILKWFEKSSSANPATLRQLVGAIATQTGGKNPAHAGSVSERFQGGLNDVPFAKKVDSTKLTDDDSAEVEAALGDVEAKWKEIGIFLGLEIKKLNGLKEMPQMVEMWLSEQYDIEHFGDPSWQKLVSAVGSKAGAGDVAAAEDIASKHVDPNFKEPPADAATPAPGSTEPEKVVKITDEKDYCVMKVDGKRKLTFYSMKEKPHGIALVIINKTFDKKADSEVKYQPVVCNDELKMHLKDKISALGYKPVLLEDLTRNEMDCALCLASSNIIHYKLKKTKIKERVEKLYSEACAYTVSDDNGKTRDEILGSNVTSAGSDSFMVVVISRGMLGYSKKFVLGKDMNVLPVEDILNCITSDVLVGKPKMVFIQATEGEESHVKTDGTGDSKKEEPEGPGGLDCVPLSEDVVRTDATIPTQSDRLVYSCPHQDSSPTPRPSMGVVFEILNAKMHDKHLLEMLTSAVNSIPGSWKSNMTLRHNILF